ncbi:cytochrome P450 [Mycena vitilis]|nr:cytochrome P450 [Mycena vitilis]
MALSLMSLETGLLHGALLSCCIVSLVVVYLWFRPASVLHNIPGPRSPSWLFGHLAQLRLSQPYGAHEFNWQKLYGPVYRIFGCLGQERLVISDPVALQYILNSPDVAIGPDLRNSVRLLFGEKCSMGVDNEAHKRLRVALNAGFTAAAVRSYTTLIEQAAQTLAERMEESSGAWVNVCPLFSVAALSTCFTVVLGYSTKDLGEEFMTNNFEILAIACNQSSMQIMADAIGARLPSWLRAVTTRLPTEQFKTIRRAKYLADQVGTQSVREKGDAARQGLEMDTDLYGKLLNSSDTTRLSEDEIVAQTALIMVAGQDTTASTLSFALLELAKAPEFQSQLRLEIHSSHARGVGYDSMPLLNAFIKECLRLYPAEAIVDRIAVEDMVIPLSKSIKTATGEHLSQIPIRKGQILMVAIASYQQSESGWGEHAMEFNPRRWLDKNVYQGEVAGGLYSNLCSLAFLGGPRACLGWRFAILEMQVFVCELVGKFTFTLPEGQSTSTRFTTTLMPIMANGQKGAPLCVKRFV